MDDLPPVTARSGGHCIPTIKALARQVEARVDNGQLSSAMSIVERIQDRLDEVPIPAPLSIESIRAKIQDLHPQANGNDVLPPKEGDPGGCSVSPKDVLKVVGSLNRRSCNGVSGWTFLAIRSVMLWQDREARPEHRTDEKEAFIGLCLLINSACAGRLHPSVMALWSLCRAALLPKPDGGGWRPLGIGDGWSRVMGKVVAKALAEGVGADMAPLQLAVGLKHGVEIGARSAQVMYNLINDHPQQVSRTSPSSSWT